MALIPELNEDGSIKINEYGQQCFRCDGHVLFTGPATGNLTTSDGTTYDVTQPLIEVASPDHAAELAALIEKD